MRHASLTFDPAAAACDMPASLLTQRPRHATCQRYFRPSGRGMRHAGASADAGEFGRVRAFAPSGGRCIRAAQGFALGCETPGRRGPFFILMSCARFHHVICATRILVRLRGQRSIRKTCVSIRNITYFIPPRAHGRNVHFTGALFAAYQRRMLPRVFSKSTSRKQSFTSQLTLRRSGFLGGRGENESRVHAEEVLNMYPAFRF